MSQYAGKEGKAFDGKTDGFKDDGRARCGTCIVPRYACGADARAVWRDVARLYQRAIKAYIRAELNSKFGIGDT